MKSKTPPKRKPIPKFRNEAEEQNFWATADSTLYIDWAKAKRHKLPNFRPTTPRRTT